MLLFICLGNVYLHGLRNLWQILFHIGVAFLSSHQILTRQLQDKQSDCGVWGWGHGMDGSFDFPLRAISVSPFTSWLHLKFPSSKFLSTKADWSWEPRFFFTSAAGSMKLLDTWFCVRVAAESPLQHFGQQNLGAPSESTLLEDQHGMVLVFYIEWCNKPLDSVSVVLSNWQLSPRNHLHICISFSV